MEAKIPDISDDLLAKIVKLVADDRWWLLGPILKASRRGRDVVYRKDVLREANIYTLCMDPADIYTFLDKTTGRQHEGRYRKFFERCLESGNKTAFYYEGLRVVTEERDIKRGIKILKRNVPERGDATLACGILSICDGDTEMAKHYLEVYGEKHHRLGTEETRQSGEELFREMRMYRCMNSNAYKETFSFPESTAIPSPACAMDCAVDYGYYEILCNNCYLWWLARRVCTLL